MLRRMLLPVGIGALLLAALALSAGAAPLHSTSVCDFVAAPCAPGMAYDPACDVDHNGVINITDIQLTAGHWNHGGSYVSDNNHNHLGQAWIGNNNPLIIEGSFAAPNDAPLALHNTAAYGNSLNIASACDGIFMDPVGNDAVYVTAAGDDGIYLAQVNDDAFVVGTTGDDGVYVGQAGAPATSAFSAANNGFEVAGAEGFGLFVGWANDDGIRVRDAQDDGIQIGGDGLSPNFALYTPEPGATYNALLPKTANSNGEWALYTEDKILAANVVASAQVLVAQVGGDQPVNPGDVVAAIGMAEPIPGSLTPLAQVTLASADQANVAGVVSSRMALQPLPGKDGEQDLHSVDGPARSGDFVAITVLGMARVKVDDAASIQPGQRLTAADTPGCARALRSVRVEGLAVDESGPTLGMAVSDVDDGMVWVLVTPQ